MAEPSRCEVCDNPNAPGVTGEQPKSYVTITRHPLALEGAFDLANAAIEGEDMGTDDVPDLLIVSVSVTDRVGHMFGPDSPEALDLASRADSLLSTPAGRRRGVG